LSSPIVCYARSVGEEQVSFALTITYIIKQQDKNILFMFTCHFIAKKTRQSFFDQTNISMQSCLTILSWPMLLFSAKTHSFPVLLNELLYTFVLVVFYVRFDTIFFSLAFIQPSFVE